LLAGVAVAATFALARRVVGRGHAVVAAGILMAMPHVFWHMHVACFDIAVTAAHAVAVATFMWLRGSTTMTTAMAMRRAALFAAVLGICCSTKHNILVLPIVFVLTALLFRQKHTGDVTVMPWWVMAMPAVALPCYVLLWPYLWPDVVNRIGRYLAFHLHHEHYPIAYFGELLEQPPFPWLFPVVMSALTIPVAIGVLMLIGIGVAVAMFRHQASRELAWLLLVNAAFPFFLIALPSTPIFGGTKHWMNALPFLCVMAAWALSQLDIHGRRLLVVAVVVLGPGVVQMVGHWPYGLGSYNELAGFSRGAADLGMLRELTSTITAAGIRQLHPGDVNADSIGQYQRDGLLPSTLRYQGSVVRSEGAFVEPQGEFKQQMIDVWNAWGRRPDVVVDVDGVPIGVWQRAR
jgi:4-amino-4-deoxy-L-arabinose transferase-like glycosyltransferase